MQTLRLGQSVVDLQTGAVEGPQPGTLTARQRALLSLLAAAPGRLVPRDALGIGGSARAADMAISRLRKRLGPDGAAIVTVRGRGYRLDRPPPGPGADLGWGRLRLDELRVELPDRTVAVTAGQATLLRALAGRAGRPVPRAELSRALWGAGEHGPRLDLLVHRLRRRIEADPGRPRFLVSVPDRGLALLDAREAAEAPARLPAVADLVGRTGEAEQAWSALTTERRALLHGPPGIGKSALAAALAHRWRAQQHAAAWVELDGADGAEADLRLAAALGMEAADDDAVVARSLASRGPMLLVLDGELPAGWTERRDRWQAGAPALAVLAAAREAPPGWPAVELGGLAPADAAALLDRAAGRELGADGHRLASRLDGNPLALELVGRSLVDRPAARVDRQLALPLTPLRRAWQAALDRLPTEHRQAALALSQFRGPFDAADAAAVADGPDPLPALLERSIVQPTTGGSAVLPAAARELLAAERRRWAGRGEARARFHQRGRQVLATVAESIPGSGGPALDELGARWVDLDACLPAGQGLDDAAARLLAALAREAGERLPRGRRTAWADQLQQGLDDEALPPGARAACARGLHALVWDRRSRDDRVALLQRGLRLAEDEPVLAGALAGELASVLAFSFGAPAAEATLAEHPLPDDAPLDERIRRLRHEGRLAQFAGHPEAGVPTLRRAVRLAEDGGRPLLEARCRMALGQALGRSTRGVEAEHHLRRAIALTAEHGLPEQRVRASIRLGQHLLSQGLRTEATTLLRSADEAAQRAGLVRLEEQCASTLGFALVLAGDASAARAPLERALAMAQEHGARRALFVARVNLGLARTLAGEAAAGRLELAAALELSRRPGWFRTVGLAYRALAELLDGAPEAGATARAARDLAGEQAHPDAGAMAAILEQVERAAGGQPPMEDLAGGAEIEAMRLGLQAWRA